MVDNIKKRKNFYECYSIEVQGCYFNYTNAQNDIIYSGRTFKAIPISREEIIVSTDVKKGDVDIKISKNADFFSIFRLGVPYGDINVSFYLFDADANLINLYNYQSFSITVSVSDITLSCMNESFIYDQKINEAYYSRVCRFNLYDDSCGINRESYGGNLSATVIGLSTLAVSNIEQERISNFVGGFLEFERTFNNYNEYGDDFTFTYRVNIIGVGYENGDTAGRSLFYVSENIWIETGTTITIKAYEGCEKTASYCKSRFNNIGNFGGQPEIPTENPNSGAVF